MVTSAMIGQEVGHNEVLECWRTLTGRGASAERSARAVFATRFVPVGQIRM